jgi:cation diffusion facilitator CzcD-associated flavoprotein CzcO
VIQETDTIIIGAGPAGLAVGAALRRANEPFLILERAHRVGESWHRHYERLHLHTPKRHSALPFRPFPRDFPTYPSREQVLAYLDDYAAAFELRPRFGREVRRCVRNADGLWDVSTNEESYRTRHVVVATGLNRTPKLPYWPGLETFPGLIVHSSEFTNGERFRERRVLVVGFGNSGAEIALDLSEHGARTTVAVRGKVNVIPRDILGIPITSLALALRALPPRVADRMNRLTVRLAIGSLASAGLEKRDDGPLVQITEGRQIPVIDVGTLARIRAGAIAVRKGVQSFDGSEVQFADGVRERFDAMILATGFTTGLAQILPDHTAVIDDLGYPTIHGRESAIPGLYFCGFQLSRGGLLRQIRMEALHIGEEIARKQDHAAVPMHR